MSGHIRQLKFRIPGQLRTRLDEAAKESRNSLNTEIIRRIEQSFQMDELSEDMKEAQRRLDAARERNDKLADRMLDLMAPKVRVHAKSEDAA